MFEAFLDKLEAMRRFQREAAIAPHKPLVVLYALGAFQRGVRLVAFTDVERAIAPLICEFWKSDGVPRVEDPFVRLANDGFWHLNFERAAVITDSGAISVAKLRILNASAGFDALTFQMLSAKPILAVWAARILLFDAYRDEDQMRLADAIGITGLA